MKGGFILENPNRSLGVHRWPRGEQDNIVPPEESKNMIAALKHNHQTPEPRLTLYPTANHNSWDKAYREENLGQWLTTTAGVRYGTFRSNGSEASSVGVISIDSRKSDLTSALNLVFHPT